MLYDPLYLFLIAANISPSSGQMAETPPTEKISPESAQAPEEAGKCRISSSVSESSTTGSPVKSPLKLDVTVSPVHVKEPGSAKGKRVAFLDPGEDDGIFVSPVDFGTTSSGGAVVPAGRISSGGAVMPAGRTSSGGTVMPPSSGGAVMPAGRKISATTKSSAQQVK